MVYSGSYKDEVYIDSCVVRITTLTTYLTYPRTAINIGNNSEYIA
jgi:hypothetical protein